jgi:sec-independent protein translocase protein TatB
MNFLGIGPLELLILAVIALLVLGPKGMSDLGRKTGQLIRQITRSPFWQDIVNTSRDINDLPGKMMREADLEDELKNIQKAASLPADDEKSPANKAGKA